MSEIAIFAFDSAAVRTLDLNGEPWFVATDIAKILGYSEAEKMTRMLDDDERGTHNVGTPSSNQHGEFEYDVKLTIINESGLYAAILKSRRPEAKSFRKWVTSEVLPSIRKRGSYTAPQNQPSNPPFVSTNPAHGADLAVAADRTFRSFMRAGRSAGLRLPQALRVANQKTLERTGMNMLAELDVDPDAMEVSARPAGKEEPTHPIFDALQAWLHTAGHGPWRMNEIILVVFGVHRDDARYSKIVPAIGKQLRRLGLINRTERRNGCKNAHWWHRRDPDLFGHVR